MKTATFTLSAFALALTALACGSRLTADDPKGPALDTSFLKLYAETRGFMLGRPQKPKITPDGKAVLFLRAEPKTPKLKLYEFDVATGKTKELLSPEMLLDGGEENLTPEEKARRERQRITVGGFADYHLDKDGKRVLVKLSNRLYVLNRETGKVTELKTGTEGAIVDPKWSPDGKLIAYVRGHDVYVYDLAAEKESAVTTGGTQVKTHGLAEFVAQEEMGRHSGYWWSPDSKSIAYTEADHTGVEQWFIADPLKPDAPPTPQYYPRPGKKNVSVRLGVKPIAGGETVWVEWDREKWEYLAAVRWDENGPLTMQLQDRKQQQLALLDIDPIKGTAKKLLEERSRSWVNIHQNLPRWLPDGKEFFWCSEEEKAILGLYTRQGNRKLAIWPTDPDTPGSSLVELLAVDAERRGVYLISTGRQTGSSLDYSSFERLGKDGKTLVGGNLWVVGASFEKSLAVYTETITSATQPMMPSTTVNRTTEGFSVEVGRVPSVAVEPPFNPNVEIDSIPFGDEEEACFSTAIVRPRDFDPKKKYPVVVDVYGGPKHIHVVQAMRNWLVPQWLADQGFVVVAIDNRGTPGRGRDWEKAIYQKFGTIPIEDQVKGLHALCDKFPEMDRDRVGIVGWSFGGYNAANAVLRRPDVFKAAVAGAPVTDWEDYDTHYTERYLGLLPESQKAYDDANLIPLAKDLKRPLLLVHGTADDNVYYRHTLKLADSLFRAGKDFEMLPLPGITHMYSADPVVMERLWAKTAMFFKEHLGKPK